MFLPPDKLKPTVFVPPHGAMLLQDLVDLIDLAESKDGLDMEELATYLKLKPNLLGSVKMSDLIMESAKRYLHQIKPEHIPHFLKTYLATIEPAEDTKYIIFLALYLTAKKMYPEMMAFANITTAEEVYDKVNNISNYLSQLPEKK